MTLNDFHFSDLIVRVVAAIVILIVTAIVAKLVKNVLAKQLVKLKFLDRPDGSGETLAASLATLAGLVVWLFGLMAVLNLFQLTSVLTPLQGLLDGILGALPNVFAAALIFFVGYVLARIVKELVVTGLRAVNADRWVGRLGGRADAGTRRAGAGTSDSSTTDSSTTSARSGVNISEVVGQIVFALILLVVSIAALDALDIKAISDPAVRMLSLIFDAIPAVVGALILLAIGVLIARFVSSLLEPLLRGMRIGRATQAAGMDVTEDSIVTTASRVVQVVIVLFFAVAAADLLGFPQVTNILDTVLAIAGRILFGAVIIAAGVYIASLLARLSDDEPVRRLLRYGTIALFAAVGLEFMGLANSIVNLAFGSIVVGVAVAAALAYGLGGRSAAARHLERLEARREVQNRPDGSQA